jgi:hypothetical protein
MRRGLGDERLEAYFLASAEYAALRGETDRTWLQSIYHDLFGRTPDEPGFEFWLSRLAAGTPRDYVALAFAASTEREQLRIVAAYGAFLGREPDEAGLSFWLGAVTRGLTNEELVAQFLSSDEYFHSPSRGQGSTAAWIRSVYQDLLHRTASDAEVNSWLTAMAQE